MDLCSVCHKPLEGQRITRAYCSDNCRSKAYYRRRKAKEINARKDEGKDRLQELEGLSKISPDAANSLHQLKRIAGDEGLELALQAVWEALASVQCHYNFKKKVWEKQNG